MCTLADTDRVRRYNRWTSGVVLQEKSQFSVQVNKPDTYDT